MKRYRDWKKDIEAVKLVNELTDEESALVLYTNFSGLTKQMVEVMEFQRSGLPMGSSASGTFWTTRSSKLSMNVLPTRGARGSTLIDLQGNRWPIGWPRS